VAYRTDRVLTCYRIGDPDGEYAIFDTEGARLFPGRWNTSASPMLYTSEHYSTALVEKLVHSNGVLPPNQHYVRITIPNGTTFETFQPERHPGWDGRSESLCKDVGERWYLSGRSALMIVPSIPARVDRNFLINLQHPDARAITADLPLPVWWDERLFAES
jgi:RES domain-containing protein